MRIGIIGAGQLGQMLGFAARELGHECEFLDPGEAPPAAAAGPVLRAAFDDIDALRSLASRCDVLTYEFENVPVAALEAIASDIDVWPPLRALRQAQDRILEKQLFSELEIPVPPYCQVDTVDDLRAALETLGAPLIVKTRRFGYDGKGQAQLHETSDVEAVFAELGGRELIAEARVAFDFEVSIIGARSQSGEIVTWPLTRNRHASGILRESTAPFEDEALTALAQTYVERLLTELGYVGALALELFVTGDTLLANEFAPRVHNSGHWTIEGSVTSQFANHIRAVAGDSLGDTACTAHAGMLNLIGEIPAPLRDRALAEGHLHDYGKSPRPGRKLGHITVLGDTSRQRDERLAALM